MLKITILGCGSSQGVPVIGCSCAVCMSDSPYNKRRRSAILIEQNGSKIVVDFGFDIKDQLLDARVSELDGAILTHDHADHISGIDNLRIFKYLSGNALPIHTDKKTADILANRYRYLQDKNEAVFYGHDKYSLVPVGNISIQLFAQEHADIGSLGLRVGGFVYSSDVRTFPEESKKYLQDIDIWVLDCLGYKSNYAHAGLEQVLAWNDEFRPKKIYLTNMRDTIDYFEIQKDLPNNIFPSYDGMILQN